MKTKLNSKLTSIVAAFVAAASFVLPAAAEEYVAKVGETEYETLAAAVAAANETGAESVTLLADCTVDSEVVIGKDRPAAEAVTSLLSIEGTNRVDGGYYTITVKEGGRFFWDYYYTKTNISLNANIVDQTSGGNGLYLRSYGSSWFLTIAGSVTSGSDYTFYGVKFYGSFAIPALTKSASSCTFDGPVSVEGQLGLAATYNGAVTAGSISKGTFYGPVTAGVISGGSFYDMEAYDGLKAKLAEGKVLVSYGTYLSVTDSSSVAATVRRNDETFCYSTVPNAIKYAIPGDVVTMVKKYTSDLTLSNEVTLVISNSTGYAKAVLPCDAFHLIVATPAGDCVTYANALLTPETAPAYLMRDSEPVYCNGVAAAMNQSQAGDKIYLNGDCAETVAVKQGVELYLNGKNMTGQVKVSGTDEVLLFNQEASCYSSRLRSVDDPDSVASVDYTSDGQLHYFATLKDAFAKIGSGTTVTLLKDITVSSADCYSSSYILGSTLSAGKTLDGGGHTLTYTGTTARYFLNDMYGTVCNLTLAGMRSAIAYWLEGGSVFDHVKISGAIDVTGGNVGAFAIYPCTYQSKPFTLRDCEMAMTIKADGGYSNYNAAFLGNLNNAGGATFDFERCIVTGNVICGMAAMFYANPCYKTITVNATDCYNGGILHSVYSGGDFVWNPVSAYGGDGSASFTTLNLTVDGVTTTYDGLSKFKAEEVFTALTRNNGKFMHGPADEGLALQRNDHGGFAMTVAANEAATRYVISAGLYSSLKVGGSGFFAVEETVETAANGVMVLPNLMDYRFVDSDWLAANPTAVKGMHCGCTTYTLGDETFYYVSPGTYHRWVHSQPTAATVYSISAYDADGNLLSATTLSDEEYALKVGISDKTGSVTYLYETLEGGFDAVSEEGTITLFADNAESFATTVQKEFTLVAGEYAFGAITPAEGYALEAVEPGVWHYGVPSARVAKVGETEYSNIEDAIAAAMAGTEKTVTLVADLDLTQYAKNACHVIDADGVIFDLDGHTVTVNNFGVVWQGDAMCIRNGTFVAANGGSYALFVGDERTTAGIVLDNLTCQGGINVYNAAVTIAGTSAEGVSGTNYYAVWADQAAEVTIVLGTYRAVGDNPAILADDEGQLVVKGGTYTSDPTGYLAEGYQAIDNKDGTWTVGMMIDPGTGENTVPALEQQSGSSVDEQKVEKVVTDEAAKTAIKQETVVSGVKLTTAPKMSGETVVAPAGMQAVVDAAKAKNPELATALEAETASMVTVAVDVAVSPVKYENETEAAQSVAAFQLTPKATVTVVNTTGTGTEAVTTSKSETVKVTNDMIDQTAGIAVTIFTGFRPEMIVHKDENGKVIETFSADQIVWNAEKKTATVTITHFSTLEAVKESYAAQAGDALYGTLAEAFDAVKAEHSATVKVLKDLTLTNGVTFASGKTATLDFAGRTITGGTITSAGALTLTGGTTDAALACTGSGTMAITGGDYATALPAAADPTVTNAGPFFVSGGTFVSAIPPAYCAPGYEPNEKGDGKYGVKDANIFIRNIAAAQRYPWNGYVDITLDVCWSTKATARLFVLAYDGDDNRMDMTDASVIVDGVTTAVNCSKGFEVTAPEKKTIHVMWNSTEAVSEGQVKDGVHFKFVAK